MRTRRLVSFFFVMGAMSFGMACAGPKVTNLGSNDGKGPGAGTPTPGSTGSAVTYYKDVLPVVRQHCQSCHTTGGAAFALDDYDAAKPYAAPVAGAVASGEMPPWPPNPSCQHFQGERVLSDAEKKIFADWNAAGAPEGDPSDAPAAPAATPENQMETPDRTLNPGGDYTFDDVNNEDLYWCFRLDPQITQATDLVGADILPGNPEIVHHVIVFREANGQNNATGLPGFKCDGAPGEFLFAWVPGAAPLKFPAGYGMRLQPTDRLLMQVHYHRNPQAVSQVDRTAATLYFSPTPVTNLVHVSWLGTPSINVPANSDASASGDCTVGSGGADILMTAPHMHTIATKFNATLHPANGGDDQCMIDIPKWSFGWQGGYMYPQPVHVNANDVITSTCTWHNNSNQAVSFGEGTGDEMCFNFVYAVGNIPQYCFPGSALFQLFANGGVGN